MALTQEELDYLKEKYGGTIEIIEHPVKTFNHKAEFQFSENKYPNFKNTKIIIKDSGDSIVIDTSAACGEMQGTYGSSFAVRKDAPISKIFEAINISFNDILSLYEMHFGDKA